MSLEKVMVIFLKGVHERCHNEECWAQCYICKPRPIRPMNFLMILSPIRNYKVRGNTNLKIRGLFDLEGLVVKAL